MMKRIVFFLLTVSCLVASMSAHAQRSWFKSDSVKVSVNFVPSPRIKAPAYTSESSKLRWLMITVKYTMPDRKKVWVDDMKLRFSLLSAGHVDGKTVSLLITGDVTFWSVPADGREHVAIGLIPPQVMMRYGMPENKYNAAYIKKAGMMAKVEFYDGRNTRLGIGTYSVNRKVTPKKIVGVFSAAEKVTSRAIPLKGLIFDRTKTPWAALQWDRYDLIKTTDDRR